MSSAGRPRLSVPEAQLIPCREHLLVAGAHDQQFPQREYGHIRVANMLRLEIERGRVAERNAKP